MVGKLVRCSSTAGPWIEKSRFLWYVTVKLLESLIILEVRDLQCFKVSTVCSNAAKQELELEDVVGVMVGGLLLLIAWKTCTYQ
jgi:hypothetical protein